MEQLNIKAHIEAKNDIKNHLEKVWTSIVVLNELVGLSESTMKELQTKISSKIAQCDISIRDHQKLLKPYMNKEQQELLDEAYKNYEKEIIRQRQIQKEEVARLRSQGKRVRVSLIELLTQEEFINKCKSDTEFSQKWGLKIEERELRHKERINMAWTIFFPDRKDENVPDWWNVKTLTMDEKNIPTKLITITYNDKTIETYE